VGVAISYKECFMDNKQNTTWVATVPRTGSMWTTNVVREILNYSKMNVLPETLPQAEKDWLNLFPRRALSDQNEKNHYVLKVHDLLNINIPRSKVITNIRNPYDVCASFYEFMKCDIDRAIIVALSLTEVIEHYKKIDEKNLFILKYEEIEEPSSKLVLELSEFLGLHLDENAALSIWKKFSKDSVRKIIADNDKSLSDKISKKQEIDASEIVILGKNNYRSRDLNTGFQTGHISERKTGEWRLLFSESETHKIVEAIDGTAIKLGYSSEKY